MKVFPKFKKVFSSLDFLLFLSHPSLESLSSALGQVIFGLLQTLANMFGRLCHLTGQHATSLTASLRRCREVKSLLILEHTSIFLDCYNEYVSKNKTQLETFAKSLSP